MDFNVPASMWMHSPPHT